MNIVVSISHERGLTGSHRRWLLDRGVRPEHIDTPWPLHSIANNIGIDVIDGSGNLLDIAKWDIEAKRIDSLEGVAVAIGEGLLDLGGHFPVAIWRSPCQWLRAGRVGLVPLDWRGVAVRTVGRTLVASDQKERDEPGAASSLTGEHYGKGGEFIRGKDAPP